MSTASLNDTEDSVDLSSMTKAQLQEYADNLGISGVNSSSQTKAEMIAAIEAATEE